MQEGCVIINDIAIDDTFAEAFGMKATRLIITAHNLKWAQHSAAALTGFATSVIACGCEAGIERELSAEETPDARPGVSVLLFATSTKELVKQLERRVAMCVLTSPTSAVFAGVEGGEKLPLGQYVRYFGDGYQTSKLIGGKRYWRIPVMDGDFLAEDTTGMVSAIGGGNFLVLARSQVQALTACEAALEAMRKLANVIMPFPGGVVRSGSKVGSKYPQLRASTNDLFCPTIKGATRTQLSSEIESVLEIVIDGLSELDIRAAMRAGIGAVCKLGRASGVVRISAGDYGGKLGKYHFRLREIMA
jgi:formylmethanofuran--tetrahydromethanopterin N-formyltransferase